MTSLHRQHENEPARPAAALLVTTVSETPLSTRAARRVRRRRWPLVAGTTAVVLVASGAVAYGSARKTVTLDVDGTTTTVSTFAGSVDGLLAEEGVRVGDRDLVAPAGDAALRNGGDVVVRYARQVTVQADGEQTDVWTTALDAADALGELGGRDGDVRLVASRSGDRAALPLRLDTDGPVAVVADGQTRVAPDGSVGIDAVLAEEGVTLDDDDRVSVVPADPAAAATGSEAAEEAPAVSLVVQRVTTEDVTTTTAIPFETQTQQDDGRYKDQGDAVQQEGVEGVQTKVERVTTVDGVEESRETVSDETTTAPTPKIVVQGTKDRPATNSGAAASSTGPVASGSPRQIGQQLAAARGWTGSQWQCLDSLFQKESGWNPSASNPSSGAYGIPQSLPGSKMASVAGDWRTNPATQITWGLNYIAGRYGTPCGAWGHSQSVGWY